MSETFKPGEKVAWTSSGGRSVGRVEKTVTHRTRIKGHVVAASPDNPEVIVVSDASGKKAAHRPKALRRL
jgi:hypothetical protein